MRREFGPMHVLGKLSLTLACQPEKVRIRKKGRAQIGRNFVRKSRSQFPSGFLSEMTCRLPKHIRIERAEARGTADTFQNSGRMLISGEPMQKVSCFPSSAESARPYCTKTDTHRIRSGPCAYQSMNFPGGILSFQRSDAAGLVPIPRKFPSIGTKNEISF